jgi:hypothetical protein
LLSLVETLGEEGMVPLEVFCGTGAAVTVAALSAAALALAAAFSAEAACFAALRAAFSWALLSNEALGLVGDCSSLGVLGTRAGKSTAESEGAGEEVEVVVTIPG